MMVKYNAILRRSLQLFGKNPSLIIPDLLIIASFGTVGLITLLASGVVPDLLAIFNQPSGDINFSEAILLNPSIIVKLAIALISFLVANFFIGNTFIAMKYAMFNDAAVKGKAYIIQSLKSAGKLYARVLISRILIYGIYAIPIAAILFFVQIIGPIEMKNTVKGIIVLSTLGIGAAYLALAYLAFFFIFPALLRNGSVLESFKECYNYALKNKLHVVMVVLITIAITIATVIAADLISMLSVIIASPVLFILIRIILQFLVSIWMELFRFSAYKPIRQKS
jgi:hypothetical protein